MKILAFILDIIVLVALVGIMILVAGDTYTQGGVVTKGLLMGAVGGVYGLIRGIYRSWLLPKDEESDK